MFNPINSDHLKAPSELLQRLKKDPVHAPEQLALAAAELHGPYAEQWQLKKRELYRSSPDHLAKMAKKQHASLARFGGAATGVGGFITVIPDLAALAWIQSRMIFCIAAAYGFNPRDPMRPAELLVLQELYPTPEEAKAALDGTGVSIAETVVGNKLDGNETLVNNLLKIVGKRGAKKLGSKMIPGFAVVANAVGNESDTRHLANRAIRFYGG